MLPDGHVLKGQPRNCTTEVCGYLLGVGTAGGMASGSSGSGVIDAERGAVIGVASAMAGKGRCSDPLVTDDSGGLLLYIGTLMKVGGERENAKIWRGRWATVGGGDRHAGLPLQWGLAALGGSRTQEPGLWVGTSPALFLSAGQLGRTCHDSRTFAPPSVAAQAWDMGFHKLFGRRVDGKRWAEYEKYTRHTPTLTIGNVVPEVNPRRGPTRFSVV